MSVRKRALIALAGTLCLVLAACGSRVEHDMIARAGADGGVAGAGAGVDGQGDAALGDTPGGGVAGDAAGVPGAAGPGGGKPGAATATGPSGSAKGPGGATGGPGGGQSGGPPIVIGTIGTFTGAPSDAVGPVVRGLQAWAAVSNGKGGLGGRQVKVIVADDAGQPGRAKAEMRKLVEEHNVVAVVAPPTTIETFGAWKGYAEEKGVPVIGGVCGPDFAQPSPVIFQQCALNPTQIFGTAKIGAKYGKGKNFGGLFCTETDSCAAVERQLFGGGDAKRAGLNPVYSAKISLFASDFTSECLQARNNGVQLLMVIGDPGTIKRVAASCSRQNYHPQFLEFSIIVTGDMATKPGLEDMLAFQPVFPFAGLNTPAYQQFADAWKRYGGGTAPNAGAAMGWTSAKLFEKAATSAGGDISRAGLIKALRGLRGERLGGLTVPLSYGPRGVVDVKCGYFMRGSGGKWVVPNGDKPICW